MSLHAVINRGQCIRRLMALCVALACAAPAEGQSAAVDSLGTIIGIVTTREGGLPLAYSVASAPTLGRERFSNAEGIFALGELPAGPMHLRVRHLGYLPADLTIAVHAGRIDTVRVTLTHVTVRLTTVEVRAYPPCRNPGAPSVSADSAFATAFDQLRQNAEQYRLLADSYPFVTVAERTLSTTYMNGDVRVETVDTVRTESAGAWRYAPGDLVKRSGGARFPGGPQLVMNVPTLADFAERAFLDNHCFYNGGLETIDGTDLLRIDLIAATRIQSPDVNGSMYLDPHTLQIRRSVLRLSRIPRGLQGLVETEVVSVFSEALPSIPVISGIESVNRFAGDSRRPKSQASANEEQRLIGVAFLKGMPGDRAKTP